MPRTRICLVRHGETAWNALQRMQGHEDIPLNPRGLAQARAAAAALSTQRFDAIYHSDLQRAATTARIIAEPHAAPVMAEPGLRERHFGAIQGLTRDEATQRYPTLYPRIRNREPQLQPPGDGGESLETFSQRIGTAFQAIAARHAGQQVLIVSHGGCMDVMYRIVTGKPIEAPRDFSLGNATLNWVLWQDGKWHLQTWGDDAHLQNSLEEISA